MFSKYHLQIFSLWAVSSRKFRGLSLTSQDVGTVLAFSGMCMFAKKKCCTICKINNISTCVHVSLPLPGSIAIELFIWQKSHLILLGFGVLVYQLAIYPFLAKYFGPIKPFRPAAVCDKCIFVWFASVHSCKKNFESLKIVYNIWGNKYVSMG